MGMKLKQRIIVALAAICTLTGVMLLMESGVKPISAIYDKVSPGQLDFRTRNEAEVHPGGGVRDVPAAPWGANGHLRHQLGKSASRSGGSPQLNHTGGNGGPVPGGHVPGSSGATDLNNFTKTRTNVHELLNRPRPPGFPVDPNFYNIRHNSDTVTQPPHPPHTSGKYEALFRDFPSTYQVPDKATTLLRPKKSG